jgi:hypothetical protein
MQDDLNQTGRKTERSVRIHRWVSISILAILAAEFVAAVIEGRRLTAFLVLAIGFITLIPIVLSSRTRLRIPAEFQLLTILFVFFSLFLGEIRGYYTRFWWWDIALHAGSGLLLGILGFLLVYILNESERVDVHLQPRFVAVFAFSFAVTIGALWEVFEFAMDRIFATNMQKPMLGDPSGLTDTMWDLIVDAAGALIISAFGWWYMVNGKQSFIEAWIEKFIDRNPHLFRS